MTEEEYDDELVTSHSDENPELGEGGGGPDLLSEEGSAVDDLYKPQKRLGVHPSENVIYYSEYIPDVDREERS